MDHILTPEKRAAWVLGVSVCLSVCPRSERKNGLSYQHQTWYTYTLCQWLGMVKRRSKGQRSRSRGYENRHVCSALMESLPLRPSAAATGMGLHVVRLRKFLSSACVFRTTQLDWRRCQANNGYYTLEPSGRSCYYNDCPGFMTSTSECYRYRKSIAAAGCKQGFYEKGYCFYNTIP